MRVRDRLDRALQDYEDVNLGSQTARQALIDRIIDIVQKEPVDPKYWNVNETVVKHETETGEIIHPD